MPDVNEYRVLKHIYVSADPSNLDGDECGGVMTVVQEMRPIRFRGNVVRRVGTAYALCSPEDRFDADRGSAIAQGRLDRLFARAESARYMYSIPRDLSSAFSHWGFDIRVEPFCSGRTPVRWMVTLLSRAQYRKSPIYYVDFDGSVGDDGRPRAVWRDDRHANLGRKLGDLSADLRRLSFPCCPHCGMVGDGTTRVLRMYSGRLNGSVTNVYDDVTASELMKETKFWTCCSTSIPAVVDA